MSDREVSSGVARLPQNRGKVWLRVGNLPEMFLTPSEARDAITALTVSLRDHEREVSAPLEGE